MRLDTRAHVDAAAGGEGHDERDRACGPLLRGRMAARCDHHGRGGDHHPAHARLLLAPTFAPGADAIKAVVVAGRIIVAAPPSSDLRQLFFRVPQFLVESWLEHLRQHERVSQADRSLQETVERFQTAVTPKVTHLIART